MRGHHFQRGCLHAYIKAPSHKGLLLHLLFLCVVDPGKMQQVWGAFTASNLDELNGHAKLLLRVKSLATLELLPDFLEESVSP